MPHPRPDPPLRCDVLIVGGGLHGAAIARDLAGRSLRVVLCEQDDLGPHATSASLGLLDPSGLEGMAGGLGRPRHPRQIAAECHLLRRAAPHLAQALTCIAPQPAGAARAWADPAAALGRLVRMLAGGRPLPPGGLVDLARLGSSGSRQAPAGLLQPRCTHARLHPAVLVDPARLTVLCALDAAERGATVLARTRCLHARRTAAAWEATLHNRAGAAATLLARALVNATGPWADRFLREHLHADGPAGLPQPGRPPRRLKSVHIVVRASHDGRHVWRLTAGAQGPNAGDAAADAAASADPAAPPLLVVPVLGGLPDSPPGSLLAIGPLTSPWRGDPGAAVAEPADIADLCRLAARYLRRPPAADDVVHAHATVHADIGPLRSRTAGLRPHALQLDGRGAPLLTVWGGEPAAFRWLAEDAADALVGLLDTRGGTPRAAWTRHASLPGGDLSFWLDEATLEQPREPQDDLAQALAALRRRHPWIELPLARRWLAAYGDRVRRLLDGVRGPADLGPQVAPGLHDLELHYLKRVEWAASADDVLWRRTRLGLAYTSAERRQVADWFAAQAARPGVAAVHTSWHSRLGRP